MLNNDMVGNAFSDETNLKENTKVRVFSENTLAKETEEDRKLRISVNGENDSPSRQLARYIKTIGEGYVDQLTVSVMYRPDRFLRGGDHTPFNQNGFTAVRFCEYNENYRYQHQNVRVENGSQYGDLPDFLDYDYCRKIAGMNLAVLACLARAPFAPENVGIDISQLTNKTSLKWSAPAKGKKTMGYFVLMRETSSPVWEKKFYTNETSIVLPYSKDNFLFAVQSVDSEGHESLPVFPKPVK